MIRIVEIIVFLSIAYFGVGGVRAFFAYLSSRTSKKQDAYNECAAALSSKDPIEICAVATRNADSVNSQTLSHMYAEATRLSDNLERDSRYERARQVHMQIDSEFATRKKEILRQ
jgi:hypothetical protein